MHYVTATGRKRILIRLIKLVISQECFKLNPNFVHRLMNSYTILCTRLGPSVVAVMNSES